VNNIQRTPLQKRLKELLGKGQVDRVVEEIARNAVLDSQYGYGSRYKNIQSRGTARSLEYLLRLWPYNYMALFEKKKSAIQREFERIAKKNKNKSLMKQLPEQLRNNLPLRFALEASAAQAATAAAVFGLSGGAISSWLFFYPVLNEFMSRGRSANPVTKKAVKDFMAGDWTAAAKDLDTTRLLMGMSMLFPGSFAAKRTFDAATRENLTPRERALKAAGIPFKKKKKRKSKSKYY